MEKNIYDIAIVGGGPVGLFAAFYASLRKMKIALFESLPELGGQPIQLYPEKEIKDIAGFKNVKGKDFIRELLEQLKEKEISYFLGEKVLQCKKLDTNQILITTANETYLTKTLLITTGGGSFEPRKLPFSFDERLESEDIFYSMLKQDVFKNQEVVVLGGGDSAVEYALSLGKIAKKVTLIHRRETFRALQSTLEELEQSQVELKVPYVLTSIEKNEGLHLHLRHVKTKETRELITDKLLVSYGFINTHQGIDIPQLNLREGKILINSLCQTNLPGIFSCGDIATYEGKVEIIATGLGEAPTAVNNAYHFLHPNEKFQPVHSTSLQ